MMNKKREQGFILVTSFLLIAVLELFSMALFARNEVFLHSTERNKSRMVAFNMAEAGVDDTIKKLANGTINTFPYTGTFAALNATNTQGGYVVTVATPTSGVYSISATGYSPDNGTSSVIRESRAIQGYVAQSSPFMDAIFAASSISMSGNAATDSYNSNNGAYGGTNKGSNGSVGTDSTAAGTVTLSGNVTINGNAQVGPGGNPSSVITTSGNATVTGTKSAASSTQNYQPATTSIASSGSLSLSGNTNYTLSAGTYNYDSISITGNAQLTTTGAVTIYVSGSVSISGNGVSTASNKPANFLLYSTGSASVSISGNGNFYGAVYSPSSNVSISGNGSIYGAIVSNTYSQSGNGSVHYDEALQNVTGGGSLKIRSWRETNLSS